MMNTNFNLLFIMSLITSLLNGSPSFAIVEGERVSASQTFPNVFHVNVHYRTGGTDEKPQWAQADCTATLIHPRVLLTAAHCLTDGARIQFALNGPSRRGMNRHVAQKLGPTTWSEGPHPDFGLVLTSDQIERVIPHPDFGRRRLDPFETIHRDVGVIILKAEVVGVTPMRIRTDSTAAGETVRLVGYGASNVDFDSKHPHWNHKLTSTKTITESLQGRIRTHAGVGGPLEGDSGGALILESTQELVGVISGTSHDDVMNPRTRANFAALNTENLGILDELTFASSGFRWTSVYAR